MRFQVKGHCWCFQHRQQVLRLDHRRGGCLSRSTLCVSGACLLVQQKSPHCFGTQCSVMCSTHNSKCMRTLVANHIHSAVVLLCCHCATLLKLGTSAPVYKK
jgi:hypothetical protein